MQDLNQYKHAFQSDQTTILAQPTNNQIIKPWPNQSTVKWSTVVNPTGPMVTLSPLVSQFSAQSR